MKKDKKQKLYAFLEALAEVVLTMVCFGVGVFIVGLLGVDIESPNTDPDIVLLIGLVSFFIIFGIVCFLVRLLKKLIKK